jgi:myo-inositol-1(or 4)-monophosphatase
MAADDTARFEDLRLRLRAELPPIVLPALRAGASSVLAKDGVIAGDLVTDIDETLQLRLSTLLPGLWPGSRFVGEEDFVEIADPAAGAVWIVDPLDGTLNFVSGLPFFGTAVALLSGGVPVLAVVIDATTGSVWDAAAGGGAARDGRPFVHDPDLARRSMISVSSGTVLLDAEDPDLGLLARLRRTSPRLRILGSQSLQLCYAAEGRLRLVINREAKLWDDAAGWLICREAGAAYGLAGGAPLFPLAAGGPAVRGDSLFSVAGEPALVADILDHLRTTTGRPS